MTSPTSSADAFIQKWSGVTASELSTSQTFLLDLCGLLGVETPHPTAEQHYMFERPITFVHGDGSTSAGRIDLYRRGAFILESKKLKAPSHTKGFDDALLRARSQAEAYARALPAEEGRPPFVVVVDVGHRIELYAEFSRSGATYTPYPDPSSHRITLEDLRRPEILDRLRRLWTDPLSLDPSREAARVTRQIAGKLAELARSLEASGHSPEKVAQFLKCALFTMFAEDIELLPQHAFRDLLAKHLDNPDVAVQMLAALWRDMDTGGFSAVLANKVLRFNGKLFKEPAALPLTKEQLQSLLEAAKADWRHVEPAIFGTLLERALSPHDRHKLGAHYTPRAYVERLVLPTVIEPLRAEWSAAHAAALTLAAEENPKDAVKVLLAFHHRLCSVRVLDPSVGSSNFLYVTLEHLKRLEGEVLNALDELGFRQSGLDLDGKRADVAAGETVDPHNLLGIEINPRAAALAELVLWIGYLQWHFRTRGDVSPPEPVVRDFKNIENRDAVLAYDRIEIVTDENGVPVTQWDGKTMKVSPVTGEEVPDETARRPLERYVNPRKAVWPAADFIVGNPPFIGNKRMRVALGDGYVEALRSAWPDVPESADFVMYWWHNAAEMVKRGELEQFGLITTNSIRQPFNRRVIEPHLDRKDSPLSICFAIADHPWVDSGEGAAVRIAMTVARQGVSEGRLNAVLAETVQADGEVGVSLGARHGRIFADLSIGANVAGLKPLLANSRVSNRGVIPHGDGMTVDLDRATQLGLGSVPGLEKRIRPYVNGRDLNQKSRGLLAIDMFGLTADQVRDQYPAVYQWLLERVKPARDQNPRQSRRENWWLFGENQPKMRESIAGLKRYIATVQTSKHRTFFFLPADVLPDDKLIAIGLDGADHFGVLSSTVHAVWALATGSRLGVGNDPVYNKSVCFEAFPFPGRSSDAGPAWEQIAAVASKIDAHRQARRAAHPELTITGMYNTLEKLRDETELSESDRAINEMGLIAILRQLHDELDAAVLAAYGWDDLIPALRIAHGIDQPMNGMAQAEAKVAFDQAVLERLVALNTARVNEEAHGTVRWLRPEFQRGAASEHGDAGAQEQIRLGDQPEGIAATKASSSSGKPAAWPKDTVEQVRAVSEVLATSVAPLSLDDIAARFTSRGPWKKRLPQLLDMLVAVGRAEQLPGGGFVSGK